MPFLKMEKLMMGEEKLGSQEKVLHLGTQTVKIQMWRQVLHEYSAVTPRVLE